MLALAATGQTGGVGLLALAATGEEFDDLAVEEGAEELPGAGAQGALLVRRFVTIGDELTHRAATVRLATQDEKQHAVGNIEARDEALGRRSLETFEGFDVPADAALGGTLLHEFFLLLRITGGFFFGALVLDHVFRRLGDDVAFVVVALAAGAAGDLAEIAHGEDGGLLAVIFPELREDDGTDRDVDANAEGVGAADEFEQAFLRELLDEDTIFREEPGVVDADAVTEPAAHFLAVGAVETDAFEGGLQGGFFLL